MTNPYGILGRFTPGTLLDKQVKRKRGKSRFLKKLEKAQADKPSAEVITLDDARRNASEAFRGRK